MGQSIFEGSDSRQSVRASPVGVSLASGGPPASFPCHPFHRGLEPTAKKKKNKSISAKISKTNFALYPIIYCPVNLRLYTLYFKYLYEQYHEIVRRYPRAQEDNTLWEEKPWFTH